MLILASAVAVLMLFLCSSSAMRAEPQRRHSEGIAEDARILFLCTAKLLLFLHVCNSCPQTCEANVRQVVNLTVLTDYSCLRCTMPHKYDQKFKYIYIFNSSFTVVWGEILHCKTVRTVRFLCLVVLSLSPHILVSLVCAGVTHGAVFLKVLNLRNVICFY